jgi:hypothetical protein
MIGQSDMDLLRDLALDRIRVVKNAALFQVERLGLARYS